jgi:hypothetical protein
LVYATAVPVCLVGGDLDDQDRLDERDSEMAWAVAGERPACGFFDFTIAVTADGLRLEVGAPEEAHEVLAAVFGPPGPAAASSQEAGR